jgi:hypothetical protein
MVRGRPSRLMTESLLFLTVSILGGFLAWKTFKIFYLGAKESWALASKFEFLGVGLLISAWILLTPIAAAVTILIGLSSKQESFNSSKYYRIFEKGTHVTSTKERPHRLSVGPEADLILPPGNWILLKENDVKEYGSVALHAFLGGDVEYLKIHKERSPCFIWIYEEKCMPSFLQITVTDSLNSELVTPSSLEDTSDAMEHYHQRTRKILKYDLRLEVDCYTGAAEKILVEDIRYSEGGEIYEAYTILFQHKPFELAISSTYLQQHRDRFRGFVSGLSKTYRPGA